MTSHEHHDQHAGLALISRLRRDGYLVRVEDGKLVVGTLRVSMLECLRDPDYLDGILKTQSVPKINRDGLSAEARSWHADLYWSREAFPRHISERSG